MSVRKSQDARREAIASGNIVSHDKPPDPAESRPSAGGATGDDRFANGQEPPPKSEEEREKRLFQELLERYEKAICTAEELENVAIPPRLALLGNWMREGDLGFIYGERGAGKTWLINAMAAALSCGRPLADWEAPAAVDVVLVDGEMPGDLARERIVGMRPNKKRLHILHHEILFDRCGLVMNLTDQRLQRVLTEICIRKKAKVLILDNLSCLFSGIKENDADEWEKVLNWLLDLRRRRIAVIIVHHAGRTGNVMRGTSRREDAAFWVIRVDELKDRPSDETGARFETVFTKQRNSDIQEFNRQWSFQTEPGREISIGCETLTIEQKMFQLIEDGLSSASDIAQELGCAKSTVSKFCKKLIEKKLIEKNGRGYRARGILGRNQGGDDQLEGV